MKRLLSYALNALLCALCLSGDGLPLAIAPPLRSPAATPACALARYAAAPALLRALDGASYDCAEEIAAALRPLADVALVDALLARVAAERNTLVRRNALRTLGRLAESAPASRARELTTRVRAAAIQRTLATVLEREHDNFVLQDAIWLLDSFYFPSFAAQPALERISAAPTFAAALRVRAATAIGRLVYAKPGPLAATDLAYARRTLAAGAPAVRAQGAVLLARLRDDQLTPAIRAEVLAILTAAWQREPPLTLPKEPADAAPVTPLTSAEDLESTATATSARASVARALDRSGGGARLAATRTAYEALALPLTRRDAGIVLRAGPPADDLAALLHELVQTQAAFSALVGPQLAASLADETARELHIMIFPTRAVYRDYMRAFTPFTVDVDGIYDEASATIYTHRRMPNQSSNSLNESLRHELGHHFAAQHIFPGRWSDPGYHREAKGWADEGLAELLAGLELTSAGWQFGNARTHLRRICARKEPPALDALLAQRSGYDHYGRFDNDAAWALSAYLALEHPAALQRLYAAYRSRSYRLADWAAIAGLAPRADFERAWHAAIAAWCFEV